MKNTIVHIAAITSMFFWGLTYVWSKFVFETYTPLTTITLRLLGSFIVLYLFIYLTNRNEKIKVKDRKLLITSAFFNPFFYFLGEYYGLSMVSASISALIVSTIPIFTPFVAKKIFNEKLSIFNVIGLIVSFAGVLIIVLKRDFSLNASGLGISLLFLAVFSAVIYSVMVKKLTDSYSPITIIANQNLIGTLLFLPMFLYFDFNSFIEITPSTMTLLSLFMLSVFGSSICYVLYAFVIKRIDLSKANIYTNLIPIFAGIASYFFLDEYFNNVKIIGMLIVIIGIILSQVKFSRK